LTRTRILVALAALFALGTALVACGGGGGNDGPQAIVEEATLQGIESSKFDLTATMNAGGAKGGKVKATVSGAFESEEDAEWPHLDVSFSAKGKVGGKGIDREGGLTLLGNKAYVAYEGTEYEVDPTTLNFAKSSLKQGGRQSSEDEPSGCSGALSDLQLSDFVVNPKDEGNVDVGGTGTTKISGDLDVPGALTAAGELSEDPACAAQTSTAGVLLSPAELDSAKSTVKDSVKSAHLVLYVGDDHIVRRLTAAVTIEPPEGAKSSAKRVDVEVDLKLTGVNEEQTIGPPVKTRPLSDLFIKLGVNPIELLGAFQNGGGLEALEGFEDLEGLGDLFGGLGGEGGDSSSSVGDASAGGGGRQAYYDCLGEADTPVDIQNCTGLLQ